MLTIGEVVQPYTASTCGIPTGEEFDYWRDVVCRGLGDFDYELVGGGRFEAELRGFSFSGLSLSRISGSPHKVLRSKASISRMESDAFVFNFVLAGKLIAEQDGRTTSLVAGEGTICDPQRPYSLHAEGPIEIVGIRLPRQSLSSALGGLQRLTATNLGEASALCPLVLNYLMHLAERAPLLSSATIRRISQNFTELMAAMLGEIAQTDAIPLSEYRGMVLMRVKDIVERNIGNAELTPSLVAGELKLSPRYINQLLGAEGTSLSRYIWRRRLERTAEDLRDPALRGQSISRIALNNGFNDLSHFSKAFRQRFELCPRAYRGQHM